MQACVHMHTEHVRAIDPEIRSRRLDRRLRLSVCGGLIGRCLRRPSDGLGEKIDRYLAEYRVQHPPDSDLVMSRGMDGVAPDPEPKLAVACLAWGGKAPSATVVGLARCAPRTAQSPRSLLLTCRSSLCSSCPGYLAGAGHWRCLFPPSQANICAICKIFAKLASMGQVGSRNCDRAMRAASQEQ